MLPHSDESHHVAVEPLKVASSNLLIVVGDSEPSEIPHPARQIKIDAGLALGYPVNAPIDRFRPRRLSPTLQANKRP